MGKEVCQWINDWMNDWMNKLIKMNKPSSTPTKKAPSHWVWGLSWMGKGPGGRLKPSVLPRAWDDWEGETLPSHHISTKLGKPDKDELIWIQVEEKGEEDGGFVVAVVFLLGIDQIHRLYNSSGCSYHEYPMICGLLFDVWCQSVVILIPSNTVQSHCLVTLQSYLIYN